MKAPWWGKASQFHAGQWSDRVLRTSSGSLGQRAMKPASDRSCALVMTSGASSGTARTCTPRLRTAKRGPTAWYDWPSDDSLQPQVPCVCVNVCFRMLFADASFMQEVSLLQKNTTFGAQVWTVWTSELQGAGGTTCSAMNLCCEGNYRPCVFGLLAQIHLKLFISQEWLRHCRFDLESLQSLQHFQVPQ